ncbi:MAG: hypothetical protein WDW38_005658 [Sanguina aurantia]
MCLMKGSAARAGVKGPPLVTRHKFSDSDPSEQPQSLGSSGETAPATSDSLVKNVILGSALVTAVPFIWVAMQHGTDVSSWVQTVEDAVNSSGWLGPAVFIAIYALATVFLFPASILTLAAGALFGPLQGTAVVSIASTTGAALAFLVSRYLAAPLVRTRLEGYPKVQAVLEGVSQQGLRIVFLLRLSPLFPFNILNYALGLTTVGFWSYVFASWLGMLPGTFAYVYLGGVGKAAADAASGGAFDTSRTVLYVVGAIATLLATKLISNAASKALQEAQDAADQSRAGSLPAEAADEERQPLL